VPYFKAVDEGEGRWFDREDDGGEKLLEKGKPVRVRVHAPSREEERQARRAAWGTRKTGKLNNETFLKSADRGELHTREIAIQVLEDTENHYIELGAKAVSRFTELLGAKPGELKAGAALCLDGKWTAELRRAYFTEFVFSRQEAKTVADFASKVAFGASAEEEQATEDFSQP
jgi:hypothetical protein